MYSLRTCICQGWRTKQGTDIIMLINSQSLYECTSEDSFPDQRLVNLYILISSVTDIWS